MRDQLKRNLWEALVEIHEAQIWDGATLVNVMPSFHLGFRHFSRVSNKMCTKLSGGFVVSRWRHKRRDIYERLHLRCTSTLSPGDKKKRKETFKRGFEA